MQTQTQTQIHIDTEWDFSNAVVPEVVPLEIGEHICHIEKASYDPETSVYSVTLKDVENGQQSTFKYYLLTKEQLPNEMSIRILNGLKGALRGNNKGVLWPGDVVNGTVVAKVEENTYNGKNYTTVKSYHPVSRETLDLVATAFPIQDHQYVSEEE